MLLAYSIFRRLFTTPYTPDPDVREYLSRAQTQEDHLAQVSVAVLDAAESSRLFGVPLGRRGIQPVYLRIVNRSSAVLRLYIVGIDPNYYTPLEAAAFNHFSILKRLSAFGVVALVFLPILILLIPFKLLTAYWANRRMDDCFQSHAFHLRPIQPDSSAEGFVFTQLDAGTKIVRVCLHSASQLAPGKTAVDVIDGPTDSPALSGLVTADRPAADFTFNIPVPGIKADHLRRDFETLVPASSIIDCDLTTLVDRLRAMPATTTNRTGLRMGDPANLVVIGPFDSVLDVFCPRWDESEVITLSTCWKTARSFLLGSEYRYSPVSPLYMFGRSQDVALQRVRHSINERLHLRLWLSPLRYQNQPVWVGQISRDIGVRFTYKTWNLTTHRVDPDVDESREYVVEDLLQAEHVDAVGYVDGVGICVRSSPRRNLTGDPYFTDGKRAVILVTAERRAPRFVRWG